MGLVLSVSHQHAARLCRQKLFLSFRCRYPEAQIRKEAVRLETGPQWVAAWCFCLNVRGVGLAWCGESWNRASDAPLAVCWLYDSLVANLSVSHSCDGFEHGSRRPQEDECLELIEQLGEAQPHRGVLLVELKAMTKVLIFSKEGWHSQR